MTEDVERIIEQQAHLLADGIKESVAGVMVRLGHHGWNHEERERIRRRALFLALEDAQVHLCTCEDEK